MQVVLLIFGLAMSAQAAPSLPPAADWHALEEAGWLAFRQGDLTQAEAHLRKAAELSRSFPATDPRVAQSFDHLAWALASRGRIEDAEPLARWALGRREALLGPSHPETAESLNTLGVLLDAQGRLVEAEPLYRRALAIEESVQGQDGPNVPPLLDNLATVLHRQGKLAEAEPLYRRALDLRARNRQPGDEAATLHNLGILQMDRARPVEARASLEASLALRKSSLAPTHPDLASSHHALGKLSLQQGETDAALAHLEQAIKILDPSPDGAAHPLAAIVHNDYATALQTAGRAAEADAHSSRAAALRDAPP